LKAEPKKESVGKSLLMPEEAVIFEVRGSVANVTLNRPEKRNALNDAVIEGVAASLAEAEDNPSVSAVVLSGAGSDFSSGADLSALQKISNNSIVENLEDAERLAGLFKQMRRLSLPIIAAVKGRALAGGCGLATACDMVLASSSARFGYPEVKIGFVPAMVMAILRRNVSEKVAFELITGGREITAAQAEAYGLVNHVYNDTSFDNEVELFVDRFAGLSRTAVSLSKKLLYHMDAMSFEAALDSGTALNAIARMTEDCQRGISRFLKKE
jgi:methylglutaconyl-CoA hydratase